MNQALILAAGQGTRLRPLTNDRPKCLVELAGTSLLQHQVNTLRKSGVDKISVATGYRADQIQQLGLPTFFNPRFAETNMVESLFCALPHLDRGLDLIISYGDIVYQSDNLNELLLNKDPIALMIDENWRELWSLRLDNPLDDAETLIIDDQGYVQELGKKPQNYDQIQGQYTGLIKIRSDMIDQMLEFYSRLDRNMYFDGQNFDNMYMTSFLQLLIDSGWPTKAVIVHSGWLEVDSVEDLSLYERKISDGSLQKLFSIET